MIYQVEDVFDGAISGHYGFFTLLEASRYIAAGNFYYPDVSGNPMIIWDQAGEEDLYNGMSARELNYHYLSRSSEKQLRKFIVDRTGIETEYNREQTGVIVVNIVRKYSKKWLAIWNTLFYEYNPIENYNMEEVLTDQVTEFEHGHIEELLNGRTNTRTGDVKETPGVTITETEGVQGFDSTTFKNANQSISTPSGYNETKYEQLKDVLSGTDKTTHSGKDTETKNYILNRSGNIGVTTSQQMIEQERKLLMFDYFDKIVFPDIDKELTLQVY